MRTSECERVHFDATIIKYYLIYRFYHCSSSVIFRCLPLQHDVIHRVFESTAIQMLKKNDVHKRPSTANDCEMQNPLNFIQ